MSVSTSPHAPAAPPDSATMRVKETPDGSRITLANPPSGLGSTLGGVIFAGAFTLFGGSQWQNFLAVLDRWSHSSIRHPALNPGWDTLTSALVGAIIVSLIALACWWGAIWSWYGQDILFLTPGEWRMWHGLGGLGWWRKIAPESVSGISLNPSASAASVRGGSLLVQTAAGRIVLTIMGSRADQSWLRDRLQAAAGVGEIAPAVLTPVIVMEDDGPASARATRVVAAPETPAAAPNPAVPVQLPGWDLESAPDGSIHLRPSQPTSRGVTLLIPALICFGLAFQVMSSGWPASPDSSHQGFLMVLILTPVLLAGIGFLVGAVAALTTRIEWVFSTDRLEIHTRRFRRSSTTSYSEGRLRLVKYQRAGSAVPPRHVLIITLPKFTELKQEGTDPREIRALGELISRHTGWLLEIPQYWAEAERNETPAN